MKVRAIKRGYYGRLRDPDDEENNVFEIEDEKDFSENWMEKVGANDRPKPKAEKKPDPLVGQPLAAADPNRPKPAKK